MDFSTIHIKRYWTPIEVAFLSAEDIEQTTILTSKDISFSCSFVNYVVVDVHRSFFRSFLGWRSTETHKTMHFAHLLPFSSLSHPFHPHPLVLVFFSFSQLYLLYLDTLLLLTSRGLVSTNRINIC